MNPHVKRYRAFYFLGDLLALLVALLLFNSLRYSWEEVAQSWGGLYHYLVNSKMCVVVGSLVVFWLGLFVLSGYYNKPIAKSRLDEWFLTLGSVTIGVLTEFFLMVVNDEVSNTSLYLPLFLASWGIHFVCIYTVRILITWSTTIKLKNPNHWPKVLVVGNGKELQDLLQSARAMRFIPVGVIDLDKKLTKNKSRAEGKQSLASFVATAGNSSMLSAASAVMGASSTDSSLASVDASPSTASHGGEHSYHASISSMVELIYQEIEQLFGELQPQAIYLAPEGKRLLLLSPLLYRLYNYGVPLKIAVQSEQFPVTKIQDRVLCGTPLYDVTETHMTETAKNIKWLFDRVFALVCLILLSPLYAVLAVLVRRSSPGPIFYRQERIGKGGKPFMIYKFRTMYVDAESNGPGLSYEDDPRITPIGRVLRRYRLDELPQFWNVLKAEMSFVGPRPERRYYIDQIIARAPYYYLLHNVLPGITSWAMVRYGYASTVEEMIERLHYDKLYYENMSLKLDLTILFYTISTILKGKGK